MFSPQLSGMFVIIPRMLYPELKLTKLKKTGLSVKTGPG